MTFKLTESDIGRMVVQKCGAVFPLKKSNSDASPFLVDGWYVQNDGTLTGLSRNEPATIIAFADEQPTTLTLHDIADKLGCTYHNIMWFKRKGKWPRGVKPVGKLGKHLSFRASDLESIQKAFEKRRKPGGSNPHKTAVKPVSVSRGTVIKTIPITNNAKQRQAIAVELIQQGYSEAGVYLLTGKK